MPVPRFLLSCLALLLAATAVAAPESTPLGYYRFPALHGNTVVFTAEGDLWRVAVQGGLAQRLTSHPNEETNAAISPDGKWVAFSASYEGPTEVYVMPLDGGGPTRCTYEGDYATVVGWTPDGKVLYATGKHSPLPDDRLCAVDPRTHARAAVPLSQASDGCYDDAGDTLFFTRLPFQGSQTKRYQGGTAQHIWKWEKGAAEAIPLTGDFAGTSRSPMWWKGRVYFASDRDGVMNVWSMNAAGKDLRQHTHHTDYDVQSPSLDAGRIVYQHGADLYLLDLATGKDDLIPIRLASDYDQMREKWVKKPMDWVTSAHISPDGKRVALTARGQVFVAPARQGRLIELTRRKSVRYRDARFLPDAKSLVVLSDESGEVEMWKLAARGDGDLAPEQLTRDSTILRWTTAPSPDGKWIAHTDKNHRLYLYDVAAKTSKRIAASDIDDINDLTWSPDSRYLAFTQTPPNTFTQIKLYAVETGATTDVTTNRYSSYNPAFSPDGQFLYFLSDRHFRSLVGSPWGSRQPEPFFDKQTQIFYVALRPGLRSPFLPDDELNDEKEEADKKTKENEKKAKDEEKKDKPEEKTDDKKPDDKKPIVIDTDGLAARLGVVPIPAGNYGGLTTNGKRLFFLSGPTEGAPALVSVEIKNENLKTDTVLDGIQGYELSQDGKKILATKGDALYVFDAGGAPSNLGETRVNLDGWAFSFDVREEWRQMFAEAWRLHRDYLYATNMQGVDWPAMREKYRPLVDRVTDRSEFSDVLAQMVGEVSLLHAFVFGGDQRSGTDSVGVASLGAEWEPDAAAGGCRITRLYRSDPDEPTDVGPLLRPEVNLKEGDVITLINGVPASSVLDADALLRAQSGKQVRLRVHPGGDKAKARDVIVTPVSSGRAWDLRYDDWEYSRRLAAEKMSGGALGYVHLRAMGSDDIAQWQRDFYPVFDRQGLIVDVRHNGGGNIDSWILEKLQRKAWMYWNHREDSPTWNMQYAFRGPVVVLCDERTGSDAEAFAEGFRRLGLGKVIGTRTWGGEVWLSGSNTLVDRGVATAAEYGVYGPEGKWLIEGHGVDPDMVVDNLPHATYGGKDAQLEAAVTYLMAEIKKRPVTVPKIPPLPNRSFHPQVPKQTSK